MLATIELPDNKNELAFILEVLRRFNLNVQLIDETSFVSEDMLEEHAAILRTRRAAMTAPDAQFFTWEEAQNMVYVGAVLHNKRDRSILKERR